jgi:SNF2 family DNA or RNA helicase
MRGYQDRIVQHEKDNPNCAAWVDMGLGKTVSTLTAFSDMQESFDAHKALMIAPLRVARKTWDDEIQEWEHLQHLRTSHILGSEKQRLAGIEKKNADIYMINRENVAWLKAQFVKGTGKKQRLIRPWPWDTVIVDESSSFKSAKSERWKALRSLRKLYDRCIELTGTPAPNGYADLWAQMNLLDRGERLGYDQKSFYSRWFDPPDRWDPASNKYTMKDFAKKQIQEKIADIVISMKAEDYLDLPPVMRNKVPVYLTPKQLDEYRRMQKTFVMEIAGKRVTAMNMGVLTGKLLQLANGAIYTGANKAYEIFHDAKIRELMDVLDQSYGPVLVTAWYQSDMERVREAVKHWCKANHKTWDLLTDEASEDRWNIGMTDVLILHPASAGHGLNLHKNDCETIIWYGLTWSLELYQQLNARIAGGHRRIGKNVVIHHILAEGTIDEYVWNVIQDKDATQEDLLQAMKIIVQELLS